MCGPARTKRVWVSTFYGLFYVLLMLRYVDVYCFESVIVFVFLFRYGEEK